MTAGTPGGRRHLAEPKETAGSASRWSWARTSDGRAASGNGYHRAHGGPTRDEGCGSTSWNRTVLARFLTGGGQWRASRAREGASPDGRCPSELSDFAPICHFSPLTFALNSPALHHVPSCSKLRRFGGVGAGVYHSW